LTISYRICAEFKKNSFKEDIYIRPLAYKAGRAVTGFDLDKLADGFGAFSDWVGCHNFLLF